MMQVIFCFADGSERIPAEAPVYLELQRDADTPADGLELHFAGEETVYPAVPAEVRLEMDGEAVFEGITDVMDVERKGGAVTVRYRCRSRGALLLDNEAMPGEMQMPSVRSVARRFTEPFGLKAAGVDLLPKKGRLMVEEGTRCWEVICRFAEAFLHTTPYCTTDGTVCFDKRKPIKQALPPVKSLMVSRRPIERISRVVVQNARTGAYSAVYEDREAEGIQRVRYLSAQAADAPKTVFAEGKRKALQAEAAVFGFCDALPGDIFDLSGYDGELVEAELTGLRYIFTAEGEETQLKLTAKKKEEM